MNVCRFQTLNAQLCGQVTGDEGDEETERRRGKRKGEGKEVEDRERKGRR
jgi:hypothetical protein